MLGIIARPHRVIARSYRLGAGLLGVGARAQGDRRRHDREHADHTGDDRQTADDPVVAARALDDLANLAAALEQRLLDRRQLAGVGRGPGFGLDQGRVAQQQPVGAALVVPQVGLALERAQVGRAPGGIILTHRLDQPVVGQLEPCRAAALLGAHQVGVDQRPDRAVVEPLALTLRLEHLAADAL